MNDLKRPRTDVPQVQTLLLTDLCDSTDLVERLGDSAAAQLFREHDRLVLELQQRWHGRLIDRSDGLLLLFERPIDGLGFALDYTRGLRALAERPDLKQRKLVLQARAGLHVGEVLTWRNSDEAVQVGAKPLEVEGLAKPLAGRLMMLARPGQILLSATAEPLARRAARELGERSEHLMWKSWGRWRLKGVPDAQEIHEVGEPGFAPLRAPKPSAKAWRDIPLWRRPAALAAEVLLLVGIGTGAWFITRPQPAIAFGERDWVVVGDLRNLTGQAVLDESLEQAFRISLEQSRYVNVLSDMKVRDTLALMKRKPGTALDRTIASEIAIRDGARAVILPTVAEIGGRVRVSAEVIDPHSQTTVYAESADGVGVASTLDSIDKVTGELRNKLGEALSAIERDSAPLPKVSTSNLDALKAYALGDGKYAAGDATKAIGYFRRALELDPQFALAQVAIGRVQVSQGKLVEGRRNLESAAKMHDHLTSREALVLNTLLARFGPVPNLLSRWQQLIEMYPDEHGARAGLAQDGWILSNQYSSMLPHARAADVPQYAGRAKANYLEGILLLGLEKYPDAIRAFESSRENGFKGEGHAHAYAFEAKRQFTRADRAFAHRGGNAPTPSAMASLEYQFIASIDRGRWDDAYKTAHTAVDTSKADDPLFDAPRWRLWSIIANTLGDRPDAADPKSLRGEMEWLQSHASELDAVFVPMSGHHLLAIGYLAARRGDKKLLATTLARLEKLENIENYPLSQQMHQVLLAENELAKGLASAAVTRLEKLASKEDSLVATHASLLRAYRAAENDKQALEQTRWLASHRGRAFVERGVSSLLDPLNVADTTLAQLEAAELLTQLGRNDEAKHELEAFLQAWPLARLPDYLRRRVQKVTG